MAPGGQPGELLEEVAAVPVSQEHLPRGEAAGEPAGVEDGDIPPGKRLLQQLPGLPDLLLVGRVHGVAQVPQRRPEGLAGVVEQADPPAEDRTHLRVEDQVPGFRQVRRHAFQGEAEPGRAPQVGHVEPVVGVERRVAEGLVDIAPDWGWRPTAGAGACPRRSGWTPCSRKAPPRRTRRLPADWPASPRSRCRCSGSPSPRTRPRRRREGLRPAPAWPRRRWAGSWSSCRARGRRRSAPRHMSGGPSVEGPDSGAPQALSPRATASDNGHESLGHTDPFRR